MPKTKKQVPDWIEDFWKLSEVEQISEIDDCVFDNESLLELLEHSQYATVQTAIHSELNARGVEIPKRAVAVVEKVKCPTLGHLLPIATQINEKTERFQVVEKEATILMLEIGLAMEFVKQQLPHGQFEKWRNENLTISRSHAHRFRQLAQVFIKANSLNHDECLLLCDPANSKEALGEKLRQMAFDFLGDKTQAELFEQYKIKYQEPKKLTYHPPKGAELPEGETREHLVALHTWTELGESINRNGLAEETWAYLNKDERQGLYDLVNELATRLRKSLKPEVRK
jgi:hypothetical protein